MTIQSEILLSKLRKVEHYEGQPIYIDFENHTISNICDSKQKQTDIPFSWAEEPTISILHYLENSGKLKIDWMRTDESYIEHFKGRVMLTHEGSHIWQIRLTWFCRNIFLPVVISILTTLITLIVTA